MLMFDALKGVKPRRRFHLASVCAGTLAFASLGLAVPKLGARQATESALVEVLASGKRSKDARSVLVGTHAYLKFNKNIKSVATGDESILKIPPTAEIVRVVTLVGAGVGRTSVTVTFEDGTDEQYMFAVQPDISLLESALKVIDPNIQAEIAPDRDAIVLSGTVPDSTTSSEAQNAAVSYLDAGGLRGGGERSGGDPASRTGDAAQARSSGKVINLLRVASAPTALEARLTTELTRLGASDVKVTRLQKSERPNDEIDVFVVEGKGEIRTLDAIRDVLNAALPGDNAREGNPRVINQMTRPDANGEIEGVIQNAIRDQVGCPNVRVERVSQHQFRGEADILVLSGSVPTQTKLSQALTLASRLFLQQQLIKDKIDEQFEEVTETFAGGLTKSTRRPLKLKGALEDILVAADESGALHNTDSTRLGRSIGNARPEDGTSGSGGRQFGSLLGNLVESNIARAKVLELANGRILSFLTVDDLPQVRVEIKIYEINRNALLSWNPAVAVTGSDFDQNGINPNNPVDIDGDGDFDNNADGDPILGASGTDISGILGFLAGGLVGGAQLGGEHIAVDAAFSLLEQEGIARRLSSPSLTVLSGELATFGVGGQIPLSESIISASGLVTTTTTGFIDFGVNLAVRPLVDDDDFITLDVVPEISSPDAQLTAQVRISTGTNQSTTAFSTRIMRTTSRLRDGQALLIGGLTEHSRTDSSSQTPWLHQVPLVGWLFKSFDYDDSDREIVIVVNPVILRDVPDQAQLWAFPESDELLRSIPAIRKEGAK